MRTIKYILQKEFIQIFRNKTMLPIIFILPLIQMLVLVYAATMEMKTINFTIVDMDHSPLSREITDKFTASPFYNLMDPQDNVKQAMLGFQKDEVDLIIVIPSDLERSLYNQDPTEIQFMINAINGMTAGLISSYSGQILQAINQDLILSMVGPNGAGGMKQIEIKRRFWYNPSLNFQHYMVPGILVILVTLIGMFLTALNIVREKEMGTIEQINVTPIKRHQFMVGKLIPFLIIALFDLALGLFIGKLIFDVPIRGSLFVLFSFAFIYLILILGFGLLISTNAQTQQQVMFMSFFFLLIFILMSGLFTPVETMPDWAQKINYLNPFSYFMKVNRMILLKGSGFADIWKEFVYVGTYGLVILSMAIFSYRKTN